MADKEKKKRSKRPSPIKATDIYTLGVDDTAKVFGFSPQTLYNWVNTGKLIRGVHYLKIGKKLLFKREAFIKWMEEEDGCLYAG